MKGVLSITLIALCSVWLLAVPAEARRGTLVKMVSTSASNFLNSEQPSRREYIRDFDCKMTVTSAAQLDVIETIAFDFGPDVRHGIYRLIPTHYTRNNVPFDIGLRVEKVTIDGTEVPYLVRQQGHEQFIHIGNPMQTVTGVHTYKIHYLVNRAVNIFDGKPEVYWNAIGSESPFFIERATAEFILPDKVSPKDVKYTSYRGEVGSKLHAAEKATKDSIEFEAKNLLPGEALTIVIGLPAGVVDVSKYSQHETAWLIQDWWQAVAIPVAVFLFVYLQWSIKGRGAGDINIAGVDWNPPKELAPAEVGTVIDESCDLSDILSILLDLAARGYIKIKEIEPPDDAHSAKDYEFTRLEPPNAQPLKKYEQLFMFGVFGFSDTTSKLSSLKGHFYQQLEPMREDIYSSMVSNGYFSGNPRTYPGIFKGFGIMLFIVGVLLLFSLALPPAIGLILGGAILFGAAPAMSALSPKGVDAARKSMGFKRFVMKAEKERIKLLAKDDPTIFGRLLPYALAVGAADQWAATFSDLLVAPPDWYEPMVGDTAVSAFSSVVFMNALGDGIRTCASTFITGPDFDASQWISASDVASGIGGAAAGFSGFGVGGFAGGGFGGGGIGSW